MVSEGRVRGIPRGSWSRSAMVKSWRLRMNLNVLSASRRQVSGWIPACAVLSLVFSLTAAALRAAAVRTPRTNHVTRVQERASKLAPLTVPAPLPDHPGNVFLGGETTFVRSPETVPSIATQWRLLDDHFQVLRTARPQAAGLQLRDQHRRGPAASRPPAPRLGDRAHCRPLPYRADAAWRVDRHAADSGGGGRARWLGGNACQMRVARPARAGLPCPRAPVNRPARELGKATAPGSRAVVALLSLYRARDQEASGAGQDSS